MKRRATVGLEVPEGAWLIRAHQDLRGSDVDLDAALGPPIGEVRQALAVAREVVASILARVPAQPHP